MGLAEERNNSFITTRNNTASTKYAGDQSQFSLFGKKQLLPKFRIFVNKMQGYLGMMNLLDFILEILHIQDLFVTWNLIHLTRTSSSLKSSCLLAWGSLNWAPTDQSARRALGVPSWEHLPKIFLYYFFKLGIQVVSCKKIKNTNWL